MTTEFSMKLVSNLPEEFFNPVKDGLQFHQDGTFSVIRNVYETMISLPEEAAEAAKVAKTSKLGIKKLVVVAGCSYVGYKIYQEYQKNEAKIKRTVEDLKNSASQN